MTEIFFFALGLVNSLSLILVFLIRKNKLALLQRIGWLYLLLAIPAGYGLFVVRLEQKEFVETDNPRDQYFAFLPGNDNPRRHLYPEESVSPIWGSFNVVEIGKVITGPRTGTGLGVMIPKDDLNNMVRFARLKAHIRWGW